MSVADDLFQSCRPGDFDVLQLQSVAVPHFPTNWRDNATKLYLFLDDIFQPSDPMLFGFCVADDLFQSAPLELVQSSEC